MLKNLFKSAKKALKNPIVQLGIGALLPGSSFVAGMAPGLAKTVLSNPALLQGGIGLLSGDKPENVARNIGIQALLGGFRGMGEGGPGFLEGAKGTFESSRPGRYVYSSGNRPDTATIDVTPPSAVDKVIEAATKIKPETYLGFAEVLLPFALAKMAQDSVPQVEAQDIGVGNLDEYNRMLQESRFQNTGGIAGYAKGGSKEASIGINSLTGEPSGMVTGPGTGKSDSIRFTSGGAKIPTDISDGEFIMTAKATEKIGADNLYKMMNNADPESETAAEGKQRVAMA
jgi:hypothetical protein